MTATRRTATAAVVVGALALAACSGGTSDGTEPTPTPQDGPSPLEELWQQFAGASGELDLSSGMARFEQVVAECMAEQGFEYTPVDYGSDTGLVIGDDEHDPEEYARTQGYGITTWESEAALDEDTWVDESDDPNAAYVEAMSEAEREAYFAALYGDFASWTEADDGDLSELEWTPESAGCQGIASAEIYGDLLDGAADEEQEQRIDAMNEAAEAMWEAIQADPRIGEAQAEWASCMADAGHPGLASPDDAMVQFFEAQEEMWGADGLDEAAAEALREREIATATADWECQQTSGLAAVMQQVQWEHEQEFVDTHRTELEAMFAELAEAQG